MMRLSLFVHIAIAQFWCCAGKPEESWLVHSEPIARSSEETIYREEIVVADKKVVLGMFQKIIGVTDTTLQLGFKPFDAYVMVAHIFLDGSVAISPVRFEDTAEKRSTQIQDQCEDFGAGGFKVPVGVVFLGPNPSDPSTAFDEVMLAAPMVELIAQRTLQSVQDITNELSVAGAEIVSLALRSSDFAPLDPKVLD
jgi:hypothetical protein